VTARGRGAAWTVAAAIAVAAACRRAPAPESLRASTPPAPASPLAASPPADDEGALLEEAPERDPHSETVTIKLSADPARKAHIYWGRKDLGLAPLEVTRPRDSGPLDLTIITPGALTLHTRVFTDRDDRLSLHLVAEGDAPSVFGYRPDDAPATRTPEQSPRRLDATRPARPRARPRTSAPARRAP
jgi:hypothetical protein